jgi:hypothetical protein
MTSEPSFYDGFVDGILLGEGSARIFVRTLHGEKFTILLGDVKTLVMNDFRQGNIILSLGWLDATDISDPGLFGYDCEPVGADSVVPRSRFMGEIGDQQLRALEISPSYGASLMAIFKESEMKSGYLQP